MFLSSVASFLKGEKIVQLCISLLILLFMTLSQPLYAEEISPVSWPGEGESCPRAEGGGLPPLIVTGPIQAVKDAVYMVSGGGAPYEWSMSCGQISVSGVITSIEGCCGIGRIIVKDNTKRLGVMDVRLPGHWVEVSDMKYCPGAYLGSSCVEESATTQIVKYWQRISFMAWHECTECSCDLPHINSICGQPLGEDLKYPNDEYFFVGREIVRQWECY